MGGGLLFEKGRKMALNIPVNLMNTVASPNPVDGPNTVAVDTVTRNTVQPASAGSSTQDTTSDGGGMNNESNEQQALMFKQRLLNTPDKAASKSVVEAQTDQPKQSAEVFPAPVEHRPNIEDHPQSELDRFAPPNPLPTAPILQLAASYAALSAKED